jgi:hypothetical protein
MAGERLFLDAVFIEALLNRRNELHSKAVSLLPLERNAAKSVGD